MTGIGHNNPPINEELTLLIDKLFATASGSAVTISNDEQEEQLSELVKDIKKAKKSADDERKAEKKPHDDAGKKVQAKWKPAIDKCDKGVAALNAVLTPYRKKRDDEKAEAVRKAREYAAEQERKAAETLKQSEDLEELHEAEQELKAASKLNVAANKAERTASGLRTYDVATVTSARALINWIAQNDRDAMLEFLEEYARKSTHKKMDGVTVTQEKRAA